MSCLDVNLFISYFSSQKCHAFSSVVITIVGMYYNPALLAKLTIPK